MYGTNRIRDLFVSCYQIAVRAALATTELPALLPPAAKGRTIVVGAGKGAAQLARSFEQAYSHEISSGLVVTRYGFGVQCQQIEVIEAAHPVPDANSAVAAQRLLQLVSDLSPDDTVIALITGGGSALLAAPLPPLPMTLADEIELNEQLLSSGLAIGAMNTIRRHVSAIKGGRLGAATLPAKLFTLLVSDVPGDDPAEVASGRPILATALLMTPSQSSVRIDCNYPTTSLRLCILMQLHASISVLRLIFWLRRRRA